MPGLGREATESEAEAFWGALEDEVARLAKPVWGAVGALRGEVSDLRERVARLERAQPAPPSSPPAGTVELQGPSGFRLRAAWWVALLLAALAVGGVVVWRWSPSGAPPSHHGGR